MPFLTFVAVLCFMFAATIHIPSIGILLIMMGISSMIVSVCLDGAL